MNILILSPHTDDGELGCGATIVKLLEEGSCVHYATFSLCEQSVPDGFPKNILEIEVKKATTVLGIQPSHLHLYHYPVRRFDRYRQEILEDLVSLSRDFHFSKVFMPSLRDIHQDHKIVAEEGLRAFKKSTILCYEMPWNNLSFQTTGFVELQQKHLDKKVLALQQYTSQQGIRPYMERDYIISQARVHGVQIGKEYAETFEVLRWIL